MACEFAPSVGNRKSVFDGFDFFELLSPTGTDFHGLRRGVEPETETIYHAGVIVIMRSVFDNKISIVLEKLDHAAELVFV